MALLDVRDALHEVAGRATDRVAPEYWDEIAPLLGLRRRHRRTGAHPRVWRVGSPTSPGWPGDGPRRCSASPARPAGVARGSRRWRPGWRSRSRRSCSTRAPTSPSDPLLLLRAAAEAAERDLVLAPQTAARLVREAPDLPDPWPVEARDLFVRLLAAGDGLLGVWETLDETGALERILPEWERVRLLPHASVVHRFTVDRHLVETCIEASSLIRRVARADVLMVAALLHDIGKGQLTEHCVAGEPIARDDRRTPRLRRARGRADRRPRPLAPAAARDRHHPRPRRPGHRRAGHRQGRRPRGARAARRADRGGRAGDLGEGVDQVAGLAGAHAGTTGRGRALRRARARRRGRRDRDPRAGARGPGPGLGGGPLVGATAPGSPWSRATASVCSPTRPRCWRCRRPRSGRPGRGPRTGSASRSGTSPRPGSTTSCCASGSRRSSTVASTPPSG